MVSWSMVKITVYTSIRRVLGTVNELETQVDETVRTVDQSIEPVRRTAFSRFPTLFTLLVAFGATATFLGFEKLLEQHELLQRYPWLILFIGLGTLILTGTLYKKLR